jgi:hypothetical protein
MQLSFSRVVVVVLLLFTPPLIAAQSVQSFVDGAQAGSISLPARTFRGKDDPANCNVQINSSHAFSGVVTIEGAMNLSTTIDCSATGMRCLAVSGVSVIIRRINFIGNRAMFPYPSVPAAPASPSDAAAPPQHLGAPPPLSGQQLPANHPLAATGIPLSRVPDIRSSFGPSASAGFAPPAFARRGGAVAVTRDSAVAAVPDSGSVPLAGGCILIVNATSAALHDCLFSRCASAAVGGSVAALYVVGLEITRSTFSDSLVQVTNASRLAQDVDAALSIPRLSSFLYVKVPGGLGYGGSVVFVPQFELGVSVSISGSTFTRSQVVASSNNYDFFVNGDVSENGLFLQGGAIALFLPVQQKFLSSSSGYAVAITNSSFSQCLVLCTSEVIAAANFDIAMGGAISIFDFVDNELINLAPASVILHNLVFSGTFLPFSLVGCAHAIFFVVFVFQLFRSHFSRQRRRPPAELTQPFTFIPHRGVCNRRIGRNCCTGRHYVIKCN